MNTRNLQAAAGPFGPLAVVFLVLALVTGCAPVHQASPTQRPAPQGTSTLHSAAPQGIPTIPTTYSPPPEPDPALTPSAVNDLLTGLNSALRNQDANRWRSLVSGEDPRVQLLYDNLTQFESASFESAGLVYGVEAGGVPASQPPGVGSVEVRTRWRAPGERHDADHLIRFTLAASGGAAKLAGVTETIHQDDRVPLWLLEPITVNGRGPVLIAARDTDPKPWLALLSDAQRFSGAPELVAEMPSTAAGFDALLGGTRHTHDKVAAATWVDGSGPEPALRIMINPEQVAPLGRVDRGVLLTHEAVHVATRSPLSQVPLPLAEGYADLVAYDAYPDQVTVAEDQLADGLRARGIMMPTTLPQDVEFDPQSRQFDIAYGRAWMMARVLDRGPVGTQTGVTKAVYDRCASGTPWAQALADAGWSEQALAADTAEVLRRLTGW